MSHSGLLTVSFVGAEVAGWAVGGIAGVEEEVVGAGVL